MGNKGRTRTQQRRVLYEAQKRKCVFCGKFCRFSGRGGEPTLFTNEHIIPLRFGGSGTHNIVGACHKCNDKRAKEIDQAPRERHKAIFINRFMEQQRFKAHNRTFTCLS